MTGLPAGERHAMARTYAAVGWKVFPVHWIRGVTGRACSCPERLHCASAGKHPLTPRGLHDATIDRDTIDAWWRRWPGANVGLPAGDNGLAILDIDPRHGGNESLARIDREFARRGLSLPTTLTAHTGGGGWHLVFAAPEAGVKGGSAIFGPEYPGIDSRGRGGYVVAPPSCHASGHFYDWVDFNAEVAAWPVGLSWLMGARA